MTSLFITRAQRYVSTRSPVEAVWNWVSEVSNWDIIADAFAGKTNSFRHRLEFEAAPKGQKMRVYMTDPYGKKLLIWAVTEWKPKEEIVMQTEHEGFLTGFRAIASLQMETLITSQTRIRLGLELEFQNWGLKILAFFLPMQFLYGRRLNRALESIRKSVA